MGINVLRRCKTGVVHSERSRNPTIISVGIFTKLFRMELSISIPLQNSKHQSKNYKTSIQALKRYVHQIITNNTWFLDRFSQLSIFS